MMATSKDRVTSEGLLGPYKPSLIIHGGAGDIRRESLPPPLYHKYHASLESYLVSTKLLLNNGSTAIEAACHAVSLLEDNPLFNCGRGSTFTTTGEIEMEASLAVTCIDPSRDYEGKTKGSAAVSLVRNTRHPILLAREVLRMADEDGGFGARAEMHGHLSGRETEEWGWKKKGLERKGNDWFWTRKRWEEHRRGLGKTLDFDVDMELEHDILDGLEDVKELPSQGTVGAVCMDSWGVIAVATSTGGLTNKRPGRIGDTPTVGAGFWAESWVEPHDRRRAKIDTGCYISTPTLTDRLMSAATSGFDFWLGDCIPNGAEPQSERELWKVEPPSSSYEARASVRKQPSFSRPCNKSPIGKPVHHTSRAIAMSGTGNGDSFLRIVAARTTAAMARFTSMSLDQAVSDIAGRGGQLQKSAKDRWMKTGEGQGGIIGIELVANQETTDASVVFDFNCGGMWRAYYVKNEEGMEMPQVMVFREEY